jgi:hypothetical protein
MLGSAVSSSTPIDFQPSSTMGVLGSCPAMKFHAGSAPAFMPWFAVGMQRALDSAIGLPRRSTSPSRMPAFLMPAEVSRSLMDANPSTTPREDRDEETDGDHDAEPRRGDAGAGRAGGGPERRLHVRWLDGAVRGRGGLKAKAAEVSGPIDLLLGRRT